MKLRHFERSWHGIEFKSLGARYSEDQPADDSFYAAFYAALDYNATYDEEWTSDIEDWKVSKTRLGIWVKDRFLETLALKGKHRPRILSLGVGEAIIERGWLELGFDVTLNEIQNHSLKGIKKKYSDLEIIIGKIYDLSIPGKYDVVCMFAVDYALNNDNLQKTFSKVNSLLAEDGIFLNQTVNLLSFRQVVVSTIRRYFLRTYQSPDYVFWGWWRSPGLISKLARKAGLETSQQFVSDGQGYSERRQFLRRFPTLRANDMVTVFSKSRHS